MMNRIAYIGLFSIMCWTASAQDGRLDSTFGSGGKVVTTIGTGYDVGYGVAIQPDGKLVVVGYSDNGIESNDVLIMRYNVNGTLDQSFGKGGKRLTPVGEKSDAGRALALQPDGKIVVAGSDFNGTETNIVLLRYTTSGNLDSSFGFGGMSIISFGSTNDLAFDVEVYPDGRIIIAGTTGTGINTDIAIARFTDTGSLDTTFGKGGKVKMGLGSGQDNALCLALQNDGKILIAGNSKRLSSTDIALIRLTENGAPDSTFDKDGRVFTAVGTISSHAYGIHLLNNGKIILAGFYYLTALNSAAAVLRYASDGNLDSTFGKNGIATHDLNTSEDQMICSALQTDGKIVLAGLSKKNSNDDIAVARFTAEGAIDSTFDGDGKTVTPISTNNETAADIAIQADGKIVIVGYTIGFDADIALVRYVAASIPASVREKGLEPPPDFHLLQNYPNPFNPSTVISYQLPVTNHVSLKVYDAIGREVATLVNEVKEAGYYSATFDASKLSSGIYFAKLSSSGKSQIKKMMLMK